MLCSPLWVGAINLLVFSGAIGFGLAVIRCGRVLFVSGLCWIGWEVVRFRWDPVVAASGLGMRKPGTIEGTRLEVV